MVLLGSADEWTRWVTFSTLIEAGKITRCMCTHDHSSHWSATIIHAIQKTCRFLSRIILNTPGNNLSKRWRRNHSVKRWEWSGELFWVTDWGMRNGCSQEFQVSSPLLVHRMHYDTTWTTQDLGILPPDISVQHDERERAFKFCYIHCKIIISNGKQPFYCKRDTTILGLSVVSWMWV